MNTYRFFVMAVIGLLVCTSGCAPGSAASVPAGEAYAVDLTPGDFVSAVDNPYYPLVPGAKYVYESKLEDGTTESNMVEVLHETRDVNGVTAVVVHDTVYVEGQLVEGTFDWYAQDTHGNVWYLGEAVDNYENGALVDHAGSWEWGQDGALPGIIMYADPASHIGESYRQEYYRGEAEDMADMLTATESVSVPLGSYENVVKTYDYSTLDPDLQENKFYAAGVGMIKEINLKTGEVTVLLEYSE